MERLSRPWLPLLVCGLLALLAALPFQEGRAHADGGEHGRNSSRHVLLISVDGLHEFDLQQWIAQNPGSNLARLASEGTTYTNAFTSEPSDSFPGLLAQVTGGTPKTTGVFYDDTYTRNFWPTNGTTTPNCTGTPGVETTYFEAYDFGYPNINRDAVDGGFSGIDPSLLPSAIIDGTCQKAYPHDFLETNTIFTVADLAGYYTAWSDKHPVYEIVVGHGFPLSHLGNIDLYTPEINSAVPTDPTTLGVDATIAYDTLKVNAILNEIDGLKSNHGIRTGRSHPAPAAPAVPAIFGMNFQAVSVGQKFEDGTKWCGETNPVPAHCDPSYAPGGYVPGSLAFTPQLNHALGFVDDSIGAMAQELKKEGLWDSTELIISAKHGQSPMNLNALHKIGHEVGDVLDTAGISVAQLTDDDVALVWLQDQSQRDDAVKALQAHREQANIATIYADSPFADAPMTPMFGNPLTNNRTPDIIVQPRHSTIYTHSAAKVEEHGGFTDDDRHVALLVVNGDDPDHGNHDGNRRTIPDPVFTTQIAPTILDFLGLDPEQLDAVRIQHTQALPGR